MHVISLFLTRQIPLYLESYFNVTSADIMWCFITYDVHLSHCAYTIFVLLSFHYYVTNSVFYQKENVRAFIIILGVTMKAVAFEIKPEINGFVEKFMFFSRDQFTLLAINSIFSGNLIHKFQRVSLRRNLVLK